MELLPERKRKPLIKGSCMYEQRFADLTVRVNEPYWLLHQGTCEHFLIIDSIRYVPPQHYIEISFTHPDCPLYYTYHRMLHPSDPTQGYPLTLHITPPIIDLCMACSRVPAALSIVGDIRLGQSPFKICRPCWQLFGGKPPPGDSTCSGSGGRANVLVVPLPKYEHGW